MDRPLTAFAAGFGYKDDPDQNETKADAIQPYLSFLRLSVFQHGAYRWTRPSDGKIFFFNYNTEVDTEQQFTIDLKDEYRDSLGVRLTLSSS